MNGVELTLELAPHIAPLLAQRTKNLAEYTPADLTFGNLWLFRREHQWRWHDGSWPYISGLSYDRQSIALPLFDLKHAPIDIIRTLIANHGPLFPLCRHEIGTVGNTGFELTNNRDDADYIYQAQAFRTYKGRALRKKANLMAQLISAHTIEVKPYGTHMRHIALSVLNDWMQEKGKAHGDADEDACKDALNLAPELRLQGFLYLADKQPAGFLLAEPLQEGVWAIRFAKGLARFKGISQYMFHHFACQDKAEDGFVVNWLNFEQDLGLANFRHTKTSYRPAFLLPKWRLFSST
ncbi:phosphatidylglycerol lysyltransferase domain-containing protein [Kordiimonas pumila]|uniref:Phosphatidylglycerol lysyltransferase domain-containing protein n=1 Tax=Kordiimonas pumila TaxID=2161677 RepID=A0ABV7D2Q2_9PROT|nr:phosphatidylglycerol lysyltransferase domain-containing protein [Kordiimonas pumila]